MYHLDGPRHYLRAHRIYVPFDNVHLAFGGLLENLFTWAMLLADDSAAKLLHWFYGLLLLGSLYAGGRRILGHESAWLPVAVLCTAPMLFTLMPWAYNDLGLAFYEILAFLALMRWYETPAGSENPRRWPALCGLLCGLALGFKYTAFTIPLALGLLALWWMWRSRAGWRTILKTEAVLALTTMLVAAPWFIRNWAFWGNPVYPFVFGGKWWNSWRTWWYQQLGTGIGWDPVGILTLPWTASLTVKDISFREARTGPFFVVMLPLTLGVTLFYRKRDRLGSSESAARAALAMVGIQYALWTYGAINSRNLLQARLLLPALALFALPTALAVERLGDLNIPQLSLRRFALAVLALVLAFNALDLAVAWAGENPVPYLMGLESGDEYLARRLGAYYVTMRYVNEHLTSRDRVLFLWEPRGYYCRVPYQPDPFLDQFPRLVEEEGDAQGIWRRLRSEGFTHVLVFKTGMEFLRENPPSPDFELVRDGDVAALSALEGDFLELVYRNEHYELYRLALNHEDTKTPRNSKK